MDTQTAVKDIPSGMEVTLGKVVLRVVALNPGIVRFRYAPNSTFGPNESFAVLKDSGFSTPEVKVLDKGPEVVAQTGELSIVVNKSSLAVTVYDA